jgi:predicted TPR repeat methyltransferase
MSKSTSGNAIADRRYAYAMAYRDAGDLAASAELLAQALEAAPGWTQGWLALGEARELAGETDSAGTAYREALTLDPSDRAGAKVRLARLGALTHADALTPTHVAALFDDYAPRFETSLVGGLAYRGPALLQEAVLRRGERRFATMLDLGCGTGLAGAVFADRCDAMDGIDLSGAMLKRAAARGIYRGLVHSNVVAGLAARGAGTTDLVVAADVLVYLGDLGALFAAVARVLVPGGLFALTAQSGTDRPFELGLDLRYAHSPAAIAAWAKAAGMGVALLEEAWARQDRGAPVPGLVAVLEKPAARP